MGIIKLEGIRLYAYHGCLEEESIIGGEYVVDVELETDFGKSEQTDELSATIDYVNVYEIVKEQMKIRSKLIEHVAGRIAKELKNAFNGIKAGKVKVTKLSPPMNGAVDRVSVEREL